MHLYRIILDGWLQSDDRLAMLSRVFVQCAALTLIAPAFAHAQGHGTPSYRLDASQTRVVELSNLFSEPDCHPDRLVGRIVQRQFNNAGMGVESVVIEQPNGRRIHTNVDADSLEHLGMADKGWVIAGLQTLLVQRNRVALGIKMCGAAGRMIWIDSVRLAR